MHYSRPKEHSELVQLLETLPLDQTVWLAGGTDLHPAWEQDRPLPKYLVDLKSLAYLSGISDSDKTVNIGALTTVEELKRDALIQSQFGALHQAAQQFAGVQIRHRATLGGNLCNASPAADLLPGLYVHGAQVEILSAEGKRLVPVADLIQGPGKTILDSREIITTIVLPKSKCKSIFYKLGLRQAMAIAVVNLAISYEKDSSGFQSLVIAAGAVAPTVVYLKNFTRAVLEGIPLRAALPLVDKDIAPIDDLRATAEYRRKVLKNLLQYMLEGLLV